MKEYQLFIDGEFVPSVSRMTFDSINPFDGSTVARAARANAKDVERAVHAARKAFDEGPWPRMSGAERGAVLKRISDGINARTNELVALEIDDSGSTLRKAKEDVYLSARSMSYWSKLASLDPTENIEGVSKPGFARNFIVREPIGVVGAIIPWNFPLKMAVWKLGPALAAGNTIVLKPSELTPSTASELAQMCHEAGIPKGVVNIVPGFGDDAGATLVAHPLVDKVAFTGSTAVGKKIMSAASATLKKCTLECGGKSANIVLEDADLDVAVDGTLYAIFYHSGQCCEAGSRLLLAGSIYDRFIERLVARASELRVGDPKSENTDIGPLISRRQQERVLSYIEEGRKNGTRLLTGGGIPRNEALKNGFFIQPTIFGDVDNRSVIAQEEIFGPVLSAIRFSTIDEAIRLANDTIYGLGAGVWSQSPELASRVASQLRAGTVWINEWHLLSDKAPFGGYKQSGIGREFGVEGLHEYTEMKHLHIDEVGSREKKTWYDTVVPRRP